MLKITNLLTEQKLTTETVVTRAKPTFLKRIWFTYKSDRLSWSIIIFITVFFGYFLLAPLASILVTAVYVKGEFAFDTIGGRGYVVGTEDGDSVVSLLIAGGTVAGSIPIYSYVLYAV